VTSGFMHEGQFACHGEKSRANVSIVLVFFSLPTSADV